MEHMAPSGHSSVIVDGTLGRGGHASGILELAPPGSTFVGIDRDLGNLRAAEERIRSVLGSAIEEKSLALHFVHGNFQDLPAFMNERNIPLADRVYMDLGVSSVHYDEG